MNFDEYNEIRKRYKEEEGYWITTENGHKIFISEEDNDKIIGNPYVVAYIKSNEYKRYAIRLSKTELKELTESIDNTKKFEKLRGELCGHTFKDNQYLFFNVAESNYIPLHKIGANKEFGKNKEGISKEIRKNFKEKEVANSFIDMVKIKTTVDEIKGIKDKADFFKFVKGMKID